MENGRWIRIKGTHTDNCVTYQCSVCGKTALWVRGMKSLYPSDNCPHCGAGMVAKRTAVANHKESEKMKCKDCFWFSDMTVNCCERDGSDPCDPEHEACQEYEPQEQPSKSCSYCIENGKKPCCTHDCDGCTWYV